MKNNQISLIKAVAFFLVAAFLVACSQEAIKFNNVDITGSKAFGKDFALVDHHGQKKQLADFNGRFTGDIPSLTGLRAPNIRQVTAGAAH